MHAPWLSYKSAQSLTREQFEYLTPQDIIIYSLFSPRMQLNMAPTDQLNIQRHPNEK